VHKVANVLTQDRCELCTDVAYAACCFCLMQWATTDTPCQISLFSLRLRACMLQEGSVSHCVILSRQYPLFCCRCMLVYVLSQCILCRSSWVCSQHVRHCTQICRQTVCFVVEKTGSFDPVFKLTAVMYIAATVMWNLMCTGEKVFD